jgi:general secretion pathway protein F
MALYAYKAVNSLGETEEGIKNALDQQTLLSELQDQGFIPIRIELAQDKTFLGIKLGSSAVSLSQKEVLLFTGELATLLDSGLPLDRSLRVLIQLTEDNEKLSTLITQVLEKIKGGSSLADALESQAGVFSRFYLNMIRAGEMGGSLSDVLTRLAEYLERSQELKDTVATALIYPAILLVMSVASLLVMLTFVVPQFTEMFDNAGKELPVPTQVVVAIADFLQAYWWVLLLIVFTVSSYMKAQLANPVTKKIWDTRFLVMPLFGDILLHMETASLTRTLGTLLGNGVSILKALGIARETAGNLVIVDLLDDAEQELKQGKTMSDAFTDSECMPKLAIQMIKMGEETGRLEEMLLRVANIYDKQLRTSISRMLALLEPVLIITLGLMIAGIIVSILLAILSVNDLAF